MPRGNDDYSIRYGHRPATTRPTTRPTGGGGVVGSGNRPGDANDYAVRVAGRIPASNNMGVGYENAAYYDYLNNYRAQQTAPSSPGGGGGYGGGGGGGGGTPAVNQSMIDALARMLGVQGPQLQYQNLPAFRGQALGGFDPAPYRQQQQLVNQAVTADRANITANQRATGQAVQGAYTNPYATAQVQAGPQTPVMGAGLMGTAGGAASPAAANQVNAENAQNQGTFQDLLGILSANSQAGQNSRMQQVAMDANYGRQTLDAQALGMRGGIANQQTQAATQWRQQQQERAYQNSLMAQQYAVQNAQGRQATNQANWQQQNAALQARLQPVLEMITASAGTSGLNFDALLKMLQGAAR